jgi:hypothetical protein
LLILFLAQHDQRIDSGCADGRQFHGVDIQLGDVVLQIEAEALEMIQSLRGGRLLSGYRNAALANVDALAQAVCRASEQRSRQRQDAGLGSGGMRRARLSRQRLHGNVVDDAAAATRRIEMFIGGAATVERAIEIDINDRLPCVRRHRGRWAEKISRRIVHQNVQRSEPMDHRAHRLGNLFVVSNVGLDAHDIVKPALLQRGGRFGRYAMRAILSKPGGSKHRGKVQFTAGRSRIIRFTTVTGPICPTRW